MPAYVSLVAHLGFGEGQIGAAGFNLNGPEAEHRLAEQIRLYLKPFSFTKTADCVDGRLIIALADGTNEPNQLATRVVPQLPGGLVLATTKAAVGANLALIRDAKDFKQAYEIMYGLLTDLGYKDAAHADCGASKNVEASVAAQLPDEDLLKTLPAIRPQPSHVLALLGQNWQTKRRLLEDGFYGSWSHQWHEAFVSERSPDNFSILQSDDTPTHGHREQALVIISEDNIGLAKNSFVSETGQQVFGLTSQTPKLLIADVAKSITYSARERNRFLLEFDVDGPQVLNRLTAQGLPVFA